MKKISILIALIFLASCGEAEVSQNTAPVTSEQVIVETTAEIDAEVTLLPESSDVEVSSESMDQMPEGVTAQPETVTAEPQEDSSVSKETSQVQPKIVELQTTYNNPKMKVVMDIDYSVDSEGKISKISVTSPNYGGMPEFNTGIQAVVGMSVEEASEYYVSGSSLTTPAFQAALKG